MWISTLRLQGRTYPCITVRRTTTGEPDPRAVEVSPNLVDWFSGPQHTSVVEDNAEWLKVRDNTPIEDGKKRFIRLR